MMSMMLEWLIYLLAMGSVICAALIVYPLIMRAVSRSASRVGQFQQGKVEQAAKALDDIFVEVKPRWLALAYGVGPVTAGLLVFVLTDNMLFALLGAVVGVILPDVWVRQTRAIRKRTFRAQLVDALFILSSSLRAGLSLTQAFEQLESEMSPPASQEFGLMMKAHRLGRTLDESLQRLNQRIPCDELELMTTALLVARETGGDVTGIIGQLIATIRERRKLSEKVVTLTLQGRLQAYIMSLVPLAFFFFVRAFNPRYFELLLVSETGKAILATAIGLWLVGIFLLFRFSRAEV